MSVDNLQNIKQKRYNCYGSFSKSKLKWICNVISKFMIEKFIRRCQIKSAYCNLFEFSIIKLRVGLQILTLLSPMLILNKILYGQIE